MTLRARGKRGRLGTEMILERPLDARHLEPPAGLARALVPDSVERRVGAAHRVEWSITILALGSAWWIASRYAS
jgi:hypothetical protein